MTATPTTTPSRSDTINPDDLRTLLSYSEDPVGFMTRYLDVRPEFVWGGMQRVADGVKCHQRVCVKAGHGVSKTYTAARLALWFLVTHVPSTVITTAPTNEQVENLLWREIREAHAKAKIPLGGNLTTSKLDYQGECGERWFALGFATKPDTVTKQATAFQGYHNRHIMVIFDEAAGIMKEIWGAAKTLMSSGHCRWLAIGNPVSAHGEFVECFKKESWHHVTVSVKDTPNYIEGREVVPGLSGRDFEKTIRDDYGEDSNEYKSRVLGEIPDEDVDTIIPLSCYEAALNRVRTWSVKRSFGAVDVADGGDETVVYEMGDTDILDSLVFTKSGTMATANRIFVWFYQKGIRQLVIDGIGIGKGVADRLMEMGMDVHLLISSEQAADKVIYRNKRAEMWGEAGTRFKDGEIYLSHKDKVLREQVTRVLKQFRNGKMIVQPKEEIRKDLGRSPDRGDTYIMALYEEKRMKKVEDVEQVHKKASGDAYGGGGVRRYGGRGVIRRDNVLLTGIGRNS